MTGWAVEAGNAVMQLRHPVDDGEAEPGTAPVATVLAALIETLEYPCLVLLGDAGTRVFDGHPDSVTDHDGTHPRRILCPDDWVGHALQKDYKFPMEYHGIPAVTEHEQTRPIH